MKTTNARGHLIDSASVCEEMHPLYQASPSQTNIVPCPSASSGEVREYLTLLLREQHDLPEDQVQRLVAGWTMGRGHELRSYTAQMYLDIFGRDVGWVLYRDIKLKIFEAREKGLWEKHVCESACGNMYGKIG